MTGTIEINAREASFSEARLSRATPIVFVVDDTQSVRESLESYVRQHRCRD
jgi:hypothetical protein